MFLLFNLYTALIQFKCSGHTQDIRSFMIPTMTMTMTNVLLNINACDSAKYLL